MTWRVAIGLLLVFGNPGCSAGHSPTLKPEGTSELDDMAGAPEAEAPALSGAVGSRVWSGSSVRAELSEVWFYDTYGPNAAAPISGSSCQQLNRGSLTSSQQATLESVTLIALSDACTADGYRYHQLTVFDADGSAATYRDTGCSNLRVDGASAMLPSGAFSADVFPADGATECP